jgi:hypothetical protein
MISLEPRCGFRSESNPDCWSHGHGDSYPAGDSIEGVKQGYRDLVQALKNSGWQKLGGEWHCPSCVDHLKGQPQQHQRKT